MQQQKRGPGWPDGPEDVINRYGTYEVQATCGMENDFPQIAQGLSRAEKRRLKRASGQKKTAGQADSACTEAP